MAQRRMFSPDIVSTDAFLDMPVSSQVLYFHLGLRADDDGFVTPKMVMRLIGSSNDDLKVLITKRFILPFESGVVVIKHWLIHNLIRSDLYKETMYKKEKEMLGLNEYGAYTELRDGVSELKSVEAPEWLKKRRGELRTADVPQTVPRLGKDRLGKESNKEKLGEFTNVCLSTEEHQKLTARYGKSSTNILVEELSTYMKGQGKTYKDHYATLLNWAKRKGLVEVKAPVVNQSVKEVAEMSPEDLAANKARLERMKEGLPAQFQK